MKRMLATLVLIAALAALAPPATAAPFAPAPDGVTGWLSAAWSHVLAWAGVETPAEQPTRAYGAAGGHSDPNGATSTDVNLPGDYTGPGDGATTQAGGHSDPNG